MGKGCGGLWQLLNGPQGCGRIPAHSPACALGELRAQRWVRAGAPLEDAQAGLQAGDVPLAHCSGQAATGHSEQSESHGVLPEMPDRSQGAAWRLSCPAAHKGRFTGRVHCKGKQGNLWLRSQCRTPCDMRQGQAHPHITHRT